MKKVIFSLLTLMVVVSCAKTNRITSTQVELAPPTVQVDPNQPSYKAQQEQGVVTWYMNFPWFDGNRGEDIASQLIHQATGTRIQFMVGDDDRLNQMIASGELPDIITVDKSNPVALAARQWAIPLNRLADAYDPYFYQVAKEESLIWYTDDEGNIWGYPSKSNGYIDFEGENPITGEQAFLVRSDIYRAIGSPDMRTPEGFLQALRDARSYDPSIEPLAIEGLGSAGAAADMLMNLLAIHPLKEGKFHERLFDEEYLIWINTLRLAFLEGLISEDNFTNKANEFTEGMQRGKYFAILSTMLPGVGPSIIHFTQRNPDKAYIAVDGPANRNLDNPMLFSEATGIGGWTQTFVTNQAKDKERAIQLITYLLSPEGHIATNLGVEGETFTQDDDGYYILMPALMQMKNQEWEQFQRETQFGEFWMVEDPTFRFRYTNTLAPEMRQIYEWTRGKQYPLFALENSNPDPRTAEDRQWLTYQQQRQDTIVHMLRAKSEEEMLTHLNSLKALYESDGVQRALAVKNEKIAQNLRKIEKMGRN